MLLALVELPWVKKRSKKEELTRLQKSSKIHIPCFLKKAENDGVKTFRKNGRSNYVLTKTATNRYDVQR